MPPATGHFESSSPERDDFIPIPVFDASGFDTLTGSFKVRDEHGRLVAGFQVEPRHCNHTGTCHGGMLATICDGYMAVAAMYEHDLQVPILPTMSLTVDFLAPGRVGAWVEFRADVLRVTRNAVFVQGLGRVGNDPIVRASGVFKRPAPNPDGLDAGRELRRFLRKPE
ncbi:PaaI family thioesterase [Acetobacter fallax]|uniref:Hotdog fold thioesterase n=1 Tax=Acetobacter fallax TaxID=1737473 RepID=A0ABX0KC88_9PROT|nr:PaaI family thioesterase [Acetobacter fallax]NHO34030.1 hotdog fold thioesterase [Acetobacter fallax]NHO37564.1 hotdog fold thioesterase [Acetobacter fallax]